jgi:hypothetical protein
MSGLKFVFCEGKDDQAVISGIAASTNLTEIRVEPFLGKDNLRRFLRAVKLRPEFSQNNVATVAIIRDADDDKDAAFQSVCDALRNAGFPAPDRNGGFVEGAIKVGVLIVGPNDGTGMIEDLCLNSVADRPEFACVGDYFSCVAQKSDRKSFSAKAKVRVWMASQVDFEAHVGIAAEKGYWPWENPVFDPLKNFLREL